jgi:hypothetical protein
VKTITVKTGEKEEEVQVNVETRRWDPSILYDDCYKVCYLRSEYNAKVPWYLVPNELVIAPIDNLDDETVLFDNATYNASFIIKEDGMYYAFVSRNDKIIFECMHQVIEIYKSPCLDNKFEKVREIKSHKLSPKHQMAGFRDAYIFKEDRYYMFATTGGLKYWEMPPAISLYVSDTIDGEYEFLHEAFMDEHFLRFGELERPCIVKKGDIYFLTFSCWAKYRNPVESNKTNGVMFVAQSDDITKPFKYNMNVNMNGYAWQHLDGHSAAWQWTKDGTRTRIIIQ